MLKNILKNLLESPTVVLVRESVRRFDFIHHVGMTFATRVFVLGINMVSLIFIARTLGPAGRGNYAVAITLATMGVYLGLLGLNAANTYHVAQKKELVPQLLVNNLAYGFVMGFVLIVFIFFLKSFSAVFSFIESPFLFLSIISWMPIGLMVILNQSLFLGIGDIKAFNKVELITPLTGLFFMLVYSRVYQVSVDLVFLATLLGQGTGFLLTLFYLKPYLKAVPSPSWAILRVYLGYGFKKLYIPSIFVYLLFNVDLLLVKYFLGAEQAGYYSIATVMVGFLLMLPSVTGTLLFAKLPKMEISKERWFYALKVLKWLSIIITIFIMVGIVLVRPFIIIFLGETFKPAISAFIYLTPIVFFYALAFIYLNYFSALALSGINIVATGVVALLNILLNIKMIPILGIMGASLSAVLSHGLLLGIVVVYKHFMREEYQ